MSLQDEAFSLAGKTAVITGSSRGIGQAIALTFARLGANVVVSSRKLDACVVVANSINEQYGEGKALAIAANLSSKESLKELVDRAEARFGGIDVLVCNAATSVHFGPMSTIEDAQFRKTLENNIISNHWLVQFALPRMIGRGGGSIIIVSSIGGLYGSPMIGAYNISKAADFQLARTLAVENGAHGIRVNCIAPGVVRTDFARALWEDQGRLSRTVEKTPLGRIGEPDDIAGVAAFLASPASRFMTGQSLIVDGGFMVT